MENIDESTIISKRPTSIEAYYKVKDSGLLSKLRFKVFEIICQYGPMTANEMRMYASPDVNSGVFSTRLSELERMRVVNVVGVRACKTSGYNAMVWDITGDTPIKLIPKKYKSKEQKKKELIAMLNDLDTKITDMFIKHDLQQIIFYVNDNF